MKLPERLLTSLEGVTGFERSTFKEVHERGEMVVSVRFNPNKTLIPSHDLIDKKVPWSSHGYYLKERPFFTFDPLLHAGAYYVQEASSMFLEEAIKQTVNLDSPLKVLDLCAAPGGKSTLIQSLLNKESLLVSNEVIKSRVQILEENIVKWGASNVIITNNDSKDFSSLRSYFDLIVVDAPCSGSGLFRKDPEAINEWSVQNVDHCAQRQKRILADIIPCIKPGGVLIYSTCSYSGEEDEQISDWLISDNHLSALPLHINAEWGIVESFSERHRAAGYRFFPDKLKGEGFYVSCFIKNENGHEVKTSQGKIQRSDKPTRQEIGKLESYLQDASSVTYYKLGDRFFAMMKSFDNDFQYIQNNLYLRKAGVVLGKIAGNDLLPDHQLALSDILNANIPAVDVNKEQALQYLRKEEVKVDTEAKGWMVVTFKGFRLGWVKVLQNRVNNYYPKEWRILKSA